MSQPRLRVFPPETLESDGPLPEGMVPIRLADLYPVLARAYHDNYLWLRDFEDDRLLITSDLFEVVRAFADHEHRD